MRPGSLASSRARRSAVSPGWRPCDLVLAATGALIGLTAVLSAVVHALNGAGH